MALNEWLSFAARGSADPAEVSDHSDAADAVPAFGGDGGGGEAPDVSREWGQLARRSAGDAAEEGSGLGTDVLPAEPDEDFRRYLPAASHRGRTRAWRELIPNLAPGNRVGAPSGQTSAASAEPTAIEGGLAPTLSASALSLGQSSASMVPNLSSLKPKLIGGFAVAPVAGQALLHCAAAQLQGSAADMDDDYSKLDSHHLASGRDYHLLSNIAQSKVIGIDPSVLSSKLCRLAAGHWVFSRLQRTMLESSLSHTSRALSLVTYCDALSWDETPLRVALPGGVGEHAAVQPTTFCRVDGSRDLQATRRLSSSLRPDSLISKVLQTQQWAGFLVKSGGQHCKIIFQQVCPLQILQRNSAEVLQAALLEQTGCTSSSRDYHFHARVASCDSAPYNSKAFTSMGAARGQTSSLQLHCEVHDVSRAFSSTFDGLLPQHVSGIISSALSLRTSGMLATFRECLAEEVAARLVIMQGEPSPEARAHKERVMATMSSGGSKNLAQLVVLSLLPNGDWRSPNIEHYVPQTTPAPERSAIVNKLVAGLCYALVGKKPAVWARHRWTGCEIAVEELGFLESVHNLLSTTYTRLLEKVGRQQASSSSSRPTAARPSEEHRPNVDYVDPHQQTNVVPDANPSNFAGPSTLGEEQQPDVESQNFAAVNAAHRGKAQQWLATHPLDYLYLFRLVMEPLRLLMQKQFQTCSDAWERAQRVQLVQKLESGEGPLCKREYMLTLAAAGTLEASYFQNLATLYQDQDCWKLISDPNKSIGFNSLCFRLLSRGGSLVESNIAHPHRQMPYKVFDLLNDPSHAETLSVLPDCRLDSFSTGLRQAFPGFAGDDCSHTLQLVAMLSSTNIAGIESRHSSIRRHAVLKSTHTWAHHIKDLSVAWTLQQLRRARVAALPCKPGALTSATTATRAKSKSKVLVLGLPHYFWVLAKPALSTPSSQRPAMGTFSTKSV